MNGQCLGTVTMQNLYSLLAPWLLTLIETFLLIAARGLILFSSRTASRNDQPTAFHAIEQAFARPSRRRWLSILVVGLGVISIRVALIPTLGIPQPLRQLVIVAHSPRHRLDPEWVYNNAEIDAAKVLLARDMSHDRNQELLYYFKDRQVRQVDADASTPRPESYEASIR